MTKRIPIRKTHAKKRRDKMAKYGPFKKDLVLVTKGKELRGHKMCYHINPMHPDTISSLNISAMHESMKAGIVKWIKEGKVYIKKEE